MPIAWITFSKDHFTWFAEICTKGTPG